MNENRGTVDSLLALSDWIEVMSEVQTDQSEEKDPPVRRRLSSTEVPTYERICRCLSSL